MKKNEELKHYTKKKLNKKNYIIIIAPIVLSIILIVSIAIYVFIFTNPSNKLKRYLEDKNYICNKEVCSKEEDDSNYIFNYKNFIMYVENDNYRLKIDINEIPNLEIKSSEYICTYNKTDYKRLTHIDNTFIYDKKCDQFVIDINKSIDTFKLILESSDIDVNQLEK